MQIVKSINMIQLKSLLILLTLAIYLPLNAQIKYGLKAGLNASNLSFPNLPNKAERLGFHVGIFSEIPFSDFIAIQPELSYSTKGAKFRPLNEKQVIVLDYVDFLLPLSFKLSAFDLNVGPYVSYLVSKPDYKYSDKNLVLLNGFNKIDAGLSAGLYYNLNKIVFGFRYNQGFLNIADENLRLLIGNGKNAVGQISLGYKF